VNPTEGAGNSTIRESGSLGCSGVILEQLLAAPEAAGLAFSMSGFEGLGVPVFARQGLEGDFEDRREVTGAGLQSDEPIPEFPVGPWIAEELHLTESIESSHVTCITTTEMARGVTDAGRFATGEENQPSAGTNLADEFGSHAVGGFGTETSEVFGQVAGEDDVEGLVFDNLQGLGSDGPYGGTGDTEPVQPRLELSSGTEQEDAAVGLHHLGGEEGFGKSIG